MIQGSPKTISHCMVACNVYVSAACSKTAPALIQLVSHAQSTAMKHSASTSSTSSSSSTLSTSSTQVGLVHAYADVPYKRSSFHFAGSSTAVAQVVSDFASTAIASLEHAWHEAQDHDNTTSGKKETTKQAPQYQKQGGADAPSKASVPLKPMKATPHPTVGLIDHISIMPLSYEDDPLNAEPSSKQHSESQQTQIFSWDEASQAGFQLHDNSAAPQNNPTTPSGWAARSVGISMANAGADVFYYGHAHEHDHPLAQIRREKTNFFRSQHNGDDDNASAPSSIGQATIGAPPSFVENYNIRLHPCPKSQARTLTKLVREIDGGLPFVEALTLSYGELWEVACNLLQPNISSAHDIQTKMEEWMSRDESNRDAMDHGYQVGTTIGQCERMMEALRDGKRKQHDAAIMDNFHKYFKM